MLKVLLGATAALAVAVPGVASAETSGHVSVSAGNTELDFGTGDEDADLYALEGAVVTDVGENLLLQFDASNVNIDIGDGDLGSGAANVHFGTRSSGYALAGFVGLTDAIGSFKNIGVEGQFYLSQVTLNGSAAYSNWDIGDDGVDVWSLHLDGTFFFTENFGLTGGVSHSTLNADGGGPEFDLTTWGGDAEYRFDNSPFSVFGGYHYTEYEDDDLSADAWRVGLRYAFGTSSLRAQSQTGASLNGAQALAEQQRLAMLALP